MELRYVLHTDLLLTAFKRAPGVIAARIEPRLAYWAQRIASTARQFAPASFSNLVNSIKPAKVGHLHYEVRAAMNYARMVEEGTGPAAGRKKYMPNPFHLIQWVKRRGNVRWRGQPGGALRRSQMRELRDRAWGLALHIREHGTKPHPFMRPALDQHQAAFQADIGTAAVQGAREVFGQ